MFPKYMNSLNLINTEDIDKTKKSKTKHSYFHTLCVYYVCSLNVFYYVASIIKRETIAQYNHLNNTQGTTIGLGTSN